MTTDEKIINLLRKFTVRELQREGPVGIADILGVDPRDPRVPALASGAIDLIAQVQREAFAAGAES